MFSTKKIKFKKILAKDLKKILIWRNSLFIRSKMLNQKKISYKKHAKWFKSLSKKIDQKSYIIYYKEIQIGAAFIKNINFTNKSCTWGYYIGESSFRYLALFVEYKFLDLIFNKINIRKIWGETISSNKGILKIHKILGFKIEGIFKKHVKVKNKYEDIIFTSLFKNEWKLSKKKLAKYLVNLGICFD